MTATETPSDLQSLAADAWAWRAEQQPALGDDIPRLPRPAGWLPDSSPAAVDQARRRRDELLARWRSIDASGFTVAEQVDHRLLGSMLSRVDVGAGRDRELAARPPVPRPPGAQPVLRPAAPAPAVRRRAIEPRSSPRSANVPRAVDQATVALDRPAGPLTAAALEQLDGVGDRLAESVTALADELPEPHRRPLLDGLQPARDALQRLDGFLAGLHGLPDAVSVGEDAFVWFLRNVAVMAETPDELLRSARQECERAVVWEAVAKHRAASVPEPPLPASAAEQVAAEAAAEQQVRSFYDDNGFLSQPASLRHYLTAEIPAYLAPLRFLGVCDDLTDEHRLDQDGVSYTPAPRPDLPYFYAANARDTRARNRPRGRALPAARAAPTPTRIRSGVATTTRARTRGSRFYNEEYLLQAGLFDDAPHTRP